MMHRALLAALAWLFLATQSLATFVQGASNGSSTTVTSFTITFGAAVTSGDTVWGVISASNGSTITATIGGTSVTILDTVTDNTNGETTVTFILGNVTGSPTTVNVSISPTSTNVGGIAIEESGTLASSTPTDVHTGRLQTSSGTGANVLTSGSVTTTVANDIIVGASLNDGGTTEQTAGTSPNAYMLRNTFLIGTALPLVTEDNVVLATAGAVNLTFGTTQNGNYSNFVIAIKPAAAATCPKTRATMGAGC
jgi:hypothetical protein